MLQALTKTFTVAELVALGAVAVGNVNFASALPAGAMPIALVMRNKGDAVTTSAGVITGLTAQLVASGRTTNLISSTISALYTANNRGQRAVSNGSVVQDDYPFEGAATYGVRFTHTGDGTFADYTGGAAGIEGTLLYDDGL